MPTLPWTILQNIEIAVSTFKVTASIRNHCTPILPMASEPSREAEMSAEASVPSSKFLSGYAIMIAHKDQRVARDANADWLSP